MSSLTESSRESERSYHQSISTKSLKRGEWGNQVQFLLTCIGLSVGLGNIWRFPSLAYENGGSAFLFPYIICSMCFGLPALYLEFTVGQFTQTGPARCFRHFVPALQGIGWTMIWVAGTIGIFYTVIIAWAGVYLAFIWRDSDKWANCDNEWNSLNCSSQLQNTLCDYEAEQAGLNLTENLVYFNMSCILKSELPYNLSFSGTEEYFENFILMKPHEDDLLDFSQINIPVTVSLLAMWILIVLILSKGVKLIGYSSYVTATLPYLIIMALFIRAVTLPGSLNGINWYLGQPQIDAIWNYKTWTAALTQLCFSLSIGWGGLLSMASYNPRSNNCYTDAVFVVIADCFMSVFGGCTVFGILGFLAKESGKELHQVVQSGTSLAFVAYPEAMARMPFPWLWSYLFFFMVFILGLSTQITIAECICTGIYDTFPKTRKHKLFVVSAVAALNFCAGLLLCFGSGIYWFKIFNEFTGTTALCISIFLEAIVVIYCYGVQHLQVDIQNMMGKPTNLFSKIMGSSGYYIRACWMVTVPVLAVAVGILSSIREELFYGDYSIPTTGIVFGWCLAVAPALSIPVLFIANVYTWKQEGKSFWDLFRIQPTLMSYQRLSQESDENTTIPSNSTNSEQKGDEHLNGNSHKV